MNLSIFIVNYNTGVYTRRAIETVIAETVNTSYEILLLDNASTDNSSDSLKDLPSIYPQVHFFQEKVNRGFAGGNNFLATKARGKRILLLNPDTEIVDNAIDVLWQFAEKNVANKIWGGRTIFSDGTLNPSSVWARPTPFGLFIHALGISSVLRRFGRGDIEGMSGWNRDSDRAVDIVSGCYLLIDGDLWSQLKGFDSMFFMYGEDFDLCLRAAKYGARPLFCSQSTIIHHGGKSEKVLSDRLVKMLKARNQLLRRHWSRKWAVWGSRFHLMWALRQGVVWSVIALFRSTGVEKAKSYRELYRRSSEYKMGSFPARKIMAISSGGGHWVQLLRLRKSFDLIPTVFVTVSLHASEQVKPSKCYNVVDATRWNKFKLLYQLIQILCLIIKERPSHIISTGAACGYFALKIGSFFGITTVWVDSIANSEELSMSGRHIGPTADLWLTQWKHLSSPEGPTYAGSVF